MQYVQLNSNDMLDEFYNEQVKNRKASKRATVLTWLLLGSIPFGLLFGE
jgi:hypothetical protein